MAGCLETICPHYTDGQAEVKKGTRQGPGVSEGRTGSVGLVVTLVPGHGKGAGSFSIHPLSSTLIL